MCEVNLNKQYRVCWSLRIFVSVLLLISLFIFKAAATPLGNVQNVQWNGSSKWFDVTFTSGTQKARIIFYRADIFRIWVAPAGTFSNGAHADVVVYDNPLKTPPTLSLSGNYYKIETGECVLRIYKTPCRFALYRKDNTTVVFEEQAPIDITASKSTQKLKAQSNEYFYGVGGWNGHYCHNGLAVPVRYFGSGADRNYQEHHNPNSTPYYCSLKGYGAFRNTWLPGTYKFQNPVETVHFEGRFDCYYFYGPSLKKILDGYTIITGRPFMPPIWGLDFGICGSFTEAGFPWGTLDQNMAQFVQNDFPSGWNMPNDKFDTPYEPVKDMIQTYKKRNIWTNLWCGKFMADTTLRIKFVRDWGVRFFKMDNEWIGPGYKFCTDAMKTCGPEGIEKYSSDSARTFLMFTAGWAGQQRFGFPWTGDNFMTDGNWTRWHATTVAAASFSALNGITVELGSFRGSKNDRLYIRALQWQSMLPFFFCNGAWSGFPMYPWVVAPNYVDLARKSFKLHTRLVPYFYTLCNEAWRTGVSANRACVFEFPNDPKTYDNGTTSDPGTKQQFMLGPWMLCRPVYEDLTTNTTVPMYLPGTATTRWINYWSGEVSTGGRNIQAYAGGFSISGKNIVMPLYVLEGAIIPMFPEQYYKDLVLERPREPLTIDIYPNASKLSSYQVYEDDGLTREYRTGRSATTLYKCDATEWASGQKLVLKISALLGQYTGKPQTRTYIACFHTGTINKNKPNKVYIDNTETAEKTSFALLEAAEIGWFYDATDRGGILWVKASNLSTSVGHTISTNKLVGIINKKTIQYVMPGWRVVSNAQELFILSPGMEGCDAKTTLYNLKGVVMVKKKKLQFKDGRAKLWDSKGLSNGIYIVTLWIKGNQVSKKISLIH